MQNAKETLENLSYGVYVVSSCFGNDCDAQINGMTVRQVSQVSVRPPLLALSVRKKSLTHEYIRASGVFALHVLAQGQELLAGHFGLRSGRQMHKFAGPNHKIGETGAPIFDECRVWMECRVRTSHDVGSYVLIVGEIVHTGRGTLHDKAPLVFRKDDYYS